MSLRLLLGVFPVGAYLESLGRKLGNAIKSHGHMMKNTAPNKLLIEHVAKAIRPYIEDRYANATQQAAKAAINAIESYKELQRWDLPNKDSSLNSCPRCNDTSVCEIHKLRTQNRNIPQTEEELRDAQIDTKLY